MKTLGKILLALCLLLAAAITFTIGWRPFIGPRARATTSRQFERTPERLARGRYLVVGLVGCEVCHSPKDWKTHGAPNLPGMELAGQILPLPGLPGTVVASNLTPDPETGAANWTDDQIARSIRRRHRARRAHHFPHDALCGLPRSFRRGCGLHRGLSALGPAGAQSVAAHPREFSRKLSDPQRATTFEWPGEWSRSTSQLQ